MKVKTTLFVFCSFLLSMTCVLFVSANTQNIDYYMGLRIDNQDEILRIADNSVVLSNLPVSVDNTNSFPSPSDQGSQNSCVGWAVGYALKSNVEYNKRDWTISEIRHQFSPAYIYNQLVNPDSDNKNISIISAMQLIREEGVCPLSYFPYDDDDYSSQPTAIQTAAASLYKGLTYYSTFGIENIKSIIAQGTGVVIGVKSYPDLKNLSVSNQIYDSSAGKSTGNHAICLIGYDNSKGTGAFKFINSWGTSWGINGYGWISYDLVNSFVNAAGPGVGFYMTSPVADDYLMGDIDDDGIVSSADSRLALRYSVDLETPTPMQYVLADVDGDAVITSEDSRQISRYATGLIEQMPIYN